MDDELGRAERRCRSVVMPTYDFRCKECGKVTEARAGCDAPPITCPACGGNTTRDLPRRVGLLGLPTRGSSVSTAEFSATEED